MASEHVLTVTGTVFFRERIAVPPGAVATVKLVDTEGEVLGRDRHRCAAAYLPSSRSASIRPWSPIPTRS